MALPGWLRSLTQRAGDHPLASRWARARLLRSLDNSMTLALAFMHAHEVTASDILDVWGDGAEFGRESKRRDRSAGGGGGGAGLSSARASGLLARVSGLILGRDTDANEQQLQQQQQQQRRSFLAAENVHELLDEMKANVTRQVLLESAAEVQKAAASVARARAAWPEVARAIKTRQLAQELLLLKEQRVEAVAKTGLIADAEVQALQGLVERKLKSLHFRPPRFGGGRPLDSLRRHPLLAPLSTCAAGERGSWWRWCARSTSARAASWCCARPAHTPAVHRVQGQRQVPARAPQDHHRRRPAVGHGAPGFRRVHGGGSVGAVGEVSCALAGARCTAE